MHSLSNTNLLSHSSEGSHLRSRSWSSRFPLRAQSKIVCSTLLSSAGGLSSIFDIACFVKSSSHLSVHLHLVLSLCICLQISPFQESSSLQSLNSFPSPPRVEDTGQDVSIPGPEPHSAPEALSNTCHRSRPWPQFPPCRLARPGYGLVSARSAHPAEFSVMRDAARTRAVPSRCHWSHGGIEH